MRIGDLMIGDWISVNSHNSNYYQLEEFGFIEILKGMHDGDFEPIPLTAEILKKNEFELQEQKKIIEAYERGEAIEYKYKCDRDGTNSWSKVPTFAKNYQFNFYDYIYRIKGKIWRAEKDETYYFVTACMEVCSCFDTYCESDNNRFKVDNYFRTQEEAEKARDLMKECLTKFHKSL